MTTPTEYTLACPACGCDEFYRKKGTHRFTQLRYALTDAGIERIEIGEYYYDEDDHLDQCARCGNDVEDPNSELMFTDEELVTS